MSERTAPPPSPSAPGLPPARVLVVDDRPENLLALEATLTSLDVEVVRALSPTAALELVRQDADFAVIVLDVQMPGMDGYELARRIKALGNPHLTPIIFVTALDRDRRHIHAGYSAGAVDYLFKPLDPDILRAKVESFVRLYHERRGEVRRQRQRYADLEGRHQLAADQGAAAAEALRASEVRHRTLVESMDQGFAVMEVQFEGGRPVDCRFLETNRAFESQSGLPGAVGRTIREIAPWVEDDWLARYGRVATTGEPSRFQDEAPQLGRWFDVFAFRIGPPAARQVGVLFSDITAARRAAEERERLLRELEVERGRLEAVFRQSPNILALVRGPRHVLSLANDAYLQLIGRRDVLGKPLVEAVSELRDQGFDRLLDQVLQTGEPFHGHDVPIPIAKREGGPVETRYFDFVYLPLVEPDGSRSGVIAQGVDVTDQVRARRQAEEARDSASRLQSLTAALAAAISPEQVAEIVVAQGVAEAGAATGALVLRAADDPERLRILRQTGLTPEVLASFAQHPLDAAAPSARCIRTGAPLFVESREALHDAFPELADTWRALGTHAVATVPLAVGRETVAAMSFTFTAPRAFAPEEREFFLSLGAQAAQALERARLLTAERAARAVAEIASEQALAARAEAEAANHSKSAFLATMSHELRTPINAMLGYAQLLDLGLAGPLTDQQRGYLERMAASGRHLLTLINDVLDLSKIEAGESRVTPQHALTGPTVQAVLDALEPLATGKGIHVHDDRPQPDGVPFVGDPDRVRQILLNLMSNAVKFTPAGGEVTVTCGMVEETPPRVPRLRGAGPWTFVTVTDTGIGIPDHEQERVFEPFHQVDQRHTRTAGGTGLGLAISRRLARLMGGELSLESTPGLGTRFTLWLPSASLGDGGEPEAVQDRVARAESVFGAYAQSGLATIGEALRGACDTIVRAYAERLRADAGTPAARPMTRAEVEDHAASLVADLAQSLAIIDEGGESAAEMLRDGSAIQRVIAELHGRRRHAQGWTADAVERDHQLMREVVEQFARRSTAPGAAVESALQVLGRLVARAAEVSLAAWHRADAS